MRQSVRLVWWVFVGFAFLGCHRDARRSSRPAAEDAPNPIGNATEQLVTVVTDDWREFRGLLTRYERVDGTRWRQVGQAFEVVIGRQGYGWGRGLHGGGAPGDRLGPDKREGDGRSPAGVFEIGNVYGYADSRGSLALPYAPATTGLRCVDDPASKHYNRIVASESVVKDWNSAEHMKREDNLYELTIVVGHNPDATPGAGSCIFLHVWIDGETGMSGCTAMPLGTLEALAGWLRPGAKLVALPQPEYQALRAAWSLP